jgi:uncharacterized repeat protein (TIGR01451 family)
MVRTRKILAALTSVFLVATWAPALISPASANTTANATLGNFEVDGNFYDGTATGTTAATHAALAADDWVNLLAAPTVSDPVGGADTSNFSGGSKECSASGNCEPADWAQATGTAPNKDDIGHVYVASRLQPDATGHLWGYFASERQANNGTTFFDYELNQLANTSSGGVDRPNRSAGDVLIVASQHGSNDFTIGGTIQRWTLSNALCASGLVATGSAGGCWTEPTTLAAADFYGLSNDDTITDLPSSDGTLSKGLFGEFAIDLTAAGAVLGCPSTGFVAMNIRSRASDSNSAELKDWVKAPVTIPSACAELKIFKYGPNGQTAAPGATFTVTPAPGPSPSTQTSFTDGGTGDADGAANGVIDIAPTKPDVTYTVTEVTPPTGYLLPSPNTAQTVTPAKFATGSSAASVSFSDPLGSITVHKTGSGAALAGSTFSLTGTSGAALGYSTTILDAASGTNSDGTADGTLSWTGLKTGGYTLHEVSAPTGYDPVASDSTFVIQSTNDDATHGRTLTASVNDPKKTTSLTVHKTDLAGNTPISGATFDLWQESNGVAGLQTAPVGQQAADTAAGFTCTTGADGFCVTAYSQATWTNTYYWRELTVPWPFTVPNSPDNVFATPEITQANVSTALFTVEAHDPMASLATVASPSTTVASPTPLSPTATIGDRATISGIQNDAAGSVSFYVYGPGQACDSANPDVARLVGSTPIVGPGTYPAQPITTVVTVAGTYHWLAVLHIGNNVLAGSCSDVGEQVIVGKATPTLTTAATDTGTVDGTVHDVAHLRDFASSITDETVHFSLYTNSTCTDPAYWPTTAADGDVALNANGDATSPNVAVDGVHSSFYWKVSYAGDVNNGSQLEACGNADNGEISHAPLIPTPVKAPASGVVSVDGPNNTIAYTITVQNTGSATATGVHIIEPASDGGSDSTVNVFDKATYNSDAACGIGTSAGCSGSISVVNGVITWTTDIAVGASATVSFSVTVKPADADGDHIYNQAEVTSGNVALHTNVTNHVVKFPEIRVTKASSPVSGTVATPTPVAPGSDITYTLTVHNDGLADATGVAVSDAVPTGTEYVQGSADASGGVFDTNAGTVTWAVDVAAGQTVEVSFAVHVVETDLNGTLIDNTAKFVNVHTPAADCLNPAQTMCDTNTTHHEVEFAVLALAKTADPASGSIVQRGDSIDYTITVTNSGLAPASHVTVSDTLPAHVTLVPGSPSPATTTDAGGVLTWVVDVPAAEGETNGMTTITYSVTVDSDAPQGATLTNAVLIGDQCPGAPQGSDPCTTDHHVPTGDLTLVKHVDKTVAAYGGTLTYTFEAATTGALDQTAVTVTDVLPAHTTYVANSADCTDAGACSTSYDAATRTVSWQLGDIAHGAAARHLVFKVTIDTPTFDTTVGLPVTTILNSGVIVSGETAKTPSNEVKTTLVQVLGVKVVRKLATLPFTGMGMSPATAIAIAMLMMAMGAALMAARRRQD